MDEIQKNKLIEKMTANLPTLRTKASLTQARLAEIIGISRQTLVAIEKRRRKMSWNTFLSCFFVFQKNPETNQLLQIYLVSTAELEKFLKTTRE